MCTFGSVCVRSPLPSLVTMIEVPVSATRKFAPGDADVGGKEALAQHVARFGQHRGGLDQVAVGRQMGVDAAEVGLDLVLGEMHRRRDDVRGQLAADLDDVFAEVGLDRRDAVAPRGTR